MSGSDEIIPIPDFRVDDRAKVERIEVGDRVRSYDFDVHPDCYFEGTVLEITEPVEGCHRYRIGVLIRAFDGKQRMGDDGEEIIPPVNGTRNSMGGYMNGVRKVID